MENTKFQIEGTVNQVNNTGDNNMTFSGSGLLSPGKAKNVGKAEKDSWIKREVPYLKLLSYIVFAAIIFWVLAIVSYNLGFAIVDPQNIILTIVGILATFVVVSNYVQLAVMKKEIDSKIQDFRVLEGRLDENFKKVDRENRELKDKVQILNTDILKIFGREWEPFEALINSHLNMGQYCEDDDHNKTLDRGEYFNAIRLMLVQVDLIGRIEGYEKQEAYMNAKFKLLGEFNIVLSEAEKKYLADMINVPDVAQSGDKYISKLKQLIEKAHDCTPSKQCNLTQSNGKSS
jgi:hypothetical protein